MTNLIEVAIKYLRVYSFTSLPTVEHMGYLGVVLISKGVTV
jgi:hypothetical protein